MDELLILDSNPSSSELQKIFMGFLLNKAELTAREYGASIREFLSLHRKDIKRPEDIKRHHLIEFKNYLKEKGQANKTILKKMSAVSALCKHLAEENLIDRDISYGVSRPEDENKTECADFTDEEVKRIFASLDPKRYNFYQYRAILAVGFYTGLRSSEIRHLRVSEIGEVKGHKVIRTTVKGDKKHEIPLNPFVVFALHEHLEKLKELGFKLADEDYVFPILKPKANKPYTRGGLSYILERCVKKAGIIHSSFRRYSPHSMRATFAGHLLDTVEARLEDVQKLMKHSSPTTTKKYNKREKGHEKSPVYKIEF